MGYTFKAARVNAGLTQTEVSAKLGINIGTLSEWERGKRYPTVKAAKQLAGLYGITLDEFIIE